MQFSHFIIIIMHDAFVLQILLLRHRISAPKIRCWRVCFAPNQMPKYWNLNMSKSLSTQSLEHVFKLHFVRVDMSKSSAKGDNDWLLLKMQHRYKRIKCILCFRNDWQNEIQISYLHMAYRVATHKMPPRRTKLRQAHGVRDELKRKEHTVFASTEIDYFPFKKKAEPEIDVAILREILLVVWLKCHAHNQYMQTSIGALYIQFKLNNRFAFVCYPAKYNAIAISVTTNGNTRVQRVSNRYNAEHVDECAKPQQKRQQQHKFGLGDDAWRIHM